MIEPAFDQTKADELSLRSSRQRLRALLIVQGLLPLILPVTAFVWPRPPIFVWQSQGLVMFYQVLLVAIWAGLGARDWRRRVLVVVLGTTYIVVAWFVVRIRAADFAWDRLLLVATPLVWYLLIATLFSGVLLVVQSTLVDLRRVPRPVVVDRNYASRMNIRHLLALTFVCGTLLAALRFPETLFDYAWPIVMIVVLIVAVTCAAIWATLAPGWPVVRVALAVAAALGIVPLVAWRFDNSLAEALALVPGFLLLVASLLVVRRRRLSSDAASSEISPRSPGAGVSCRAGAGGRNAGCRRLSDAGFAGR